MEILSAISDVLSIIVNLLLLVVLIGAIKAYKKAKVKMKETQKWMDDMKAKWEEFKKNNPFSKMLGMGKEN